MCREKDEPGRGTVCAKTQKGGATGIAPGVKGDTHVKLKCFFLKKKKSEVQVGIWGNSSEENRALREQITLVCSISPCGTHLALEGDG